MKVFLTGFMGAGKTMVGRHLARIMNVPFFDLDHEIELASQCSVSGIFDRHGEGEFRIMEDRMLKKINLSHNSFVISTGGGTPCFNKQMDFMNKQGRTVYLNLPLDVLIQRLDQDKYFRPLISSKDGPDFERFVRNLFRERKPFYELAQIEIIPKTGNCSEIAELIREKLLGQ